MLLVRTVIILLLGLSVGSFLNVIIDRIPKNLSILGRSYCDYCRKTLGVIDLVPVFSYLYLGGRCRYCREKINVRNPIVEILTGVFFVFVFLYISPSSIVRTIELIFNLFIISSLIVIFFIDFKHQIIPDKITYPAILIALLFAIFNFQFSIFNYIFSAIGSSLFFFIIFLITRGRGLGFGDIKLVALLGLFLGFPKILIAIYFAFLTGVIVAVILILWRKKGLKDKIAFGPFLVLGGLGAFFLGDKMVSLWLNFL